MVLARRSIKNVFFPWEKRSGVVGVLQRARVRMVVVAVVSVAVIVLIRRREEREAGVRATRAAIRTAFYGVQAFRADHAGACPADLAELAAGAYVHQTPLDAWGRPLRLACPGTRDAKGFELSSDGPDGLPGGLDRVE